MRLSIPKEHNSKPQSTAYYRVKTALVYFKVTFNNISTEYLYLEPILLMASIPFDCKMSLDVTYDFCKALIVAPVFESVQNYQENSGGENSGGEEQEEGGCCIL